MSIEPHHKDKTTNLATEFDNQHNTSDSLTVNNNNNNYITMNTEEGSSSVRTARKKKKKKVRRRRLSNYSTKKSEINDFSSSIGGIKEIDDNCSNFFNQNMTKKHEDKLQDFLDNDINCDERKDDPHIVVVKSPVLAKNHRLEEE